MANYALLNKADHQDLRIITERSARYGDDRMLALAFPFEFRRLQVFYPILFQQDGEGRFNPVALFGFEEGENLFLGKQGWQAAYIPAMVRREPFLIGFKGSHGSEEERMLSLDLDHPRVSTEAGEALFEPLGQPTTLLEDTANLLETLYEGIEHNKAFVSALVDEDLLEAVTLEIGLNDGSRNQLIGYHCLAEEKVQALSDRTLGEFSRKGYLMPMFMALASMGNIQRLIDLKNRALKTAPDHELAL